MKTYVKQLAVTALLILSVSLACGLSPLPANNPFLLSTCGLTAMSNDPSTTLINPATGLSGISSSTSCLYSMKKLSQCEISSVLEYQDSGVFIGWQTLNNDDYTKQDYRFGYRFGYKFCRLGIGYKLSYDKIPEYGSEKDEFLYTGFRLSFKGTTLDAAIEPIRIDKDVTTPIERRIDVSFNQKLSKGTALACGVNRLTDNTMDYKVGCRFQTTKNLQGIVSWESEPGRFGMGALFSLSWLKVIYAVQTHPELQWTHSAGISIMFP